MMENKTSNTLARLRAVAGLCNSAEFDGASADTPLYESKINGDATDQAILRFSDPVSHLKQA